MARRLETHEKLYFEPPRDLYDAEGQLVEALRTMADATFTDKLRRAFAADRLLTTVHRNQLAPLFAGAGRVPSGHHCHGMEGLLREGDEAAVFSRSGRVEPVTDLADGVDVHRL